MPNREKERDGETNEERYYFSCHCLDYAVVPEGKGENGWTKVQISEWAYSR